MAIINTIDCAALTKNVGIGTCFLHPGQMKGAVIVRSTYEVLTASITTGLVAKLKTDAIGPKGSRVYPVHNFVSVTNNTEEPVLETLGYGNRQFVRDGVMDWLFRIDQSSGGVSLQNALRSFNLGKWAVLFYDIQADGKQVFYGVKTATGIKGIPLQVLNARPWMPSDGSTATQYNIQFVFDVKYINDLLGFVVAEADPTTIEGVQDITLSGTNASNVVTVKAHDVAAGVDLKDIYGTELADDAVWVATGDGASLAITSVATAADPNSFTVTLDSTAYSALTNGDVVTLNLVAPSALAAAQIAPFEAAAAISFTKS